MKKIMTMRVGMDYWVNKMKMTAKTRKMSMEPNMKKRKKMKMMPMRILMSWQSKKRMNLNAI